MKQPETGEKFENEFQKSLAIAAHEVPAMERNVKVKRKDQDIFNDYLVTLEAERDNRSEERVVLGMLDDYNEDQLLDWAGDRRMKIFVHNRRILITSFTSRLHEIAVRKFESAIEAALEELKPEAFYPLGTADIQVINLLGCQSTFIKQPDFSFLAVNHKKRRDPVIVGEVGVAHEDLDLLLNEAAAFLNQFTHIEYCILVKIWPSLPTFRMRILVCQRLTKHATESLESKKLRIKELKEKVKKRKRFCSKKLKLDKKNDKFIEKHYPIRVLFDQTITDASQDVIFYLQTHGLAVGTDLSFEQPTLRIAISRASITAIMAMFNEMINQ